MKRIFIHPTISVYSQYVWPTTIVQKKNCHSNVFRTKGLKNGMNEYSTYSLKHTYTIKIKRKNKKELRYFFFLLSSFLSQKQAALGCACIRCEKFYFFLNSIRLLNWQINIYRIFDENLSNV